MSNKEHKSGIFESRERTRFYNDAGIPFWNATYDVEEKTIDYPYALYTCHKESNKNIRALQQGSIQVAKVFDSLINIIKGWDVAELERWGFDSRYRGLLDFDWDDYFCMRVGWGMKEGKWKIVEVNTQTPAVWVEPEKGNPLLARQFGLRNPHPKSLEYLKQSLNGAIARALGQGARHNKKPRIGFVTADYYEDLAEVSWLADFCELPYELVTVDNFDFNVNDNSPFNIATGNKLDALVLWYPLEWLVDMEFGNGEPFWPVFLQGLRSKTFCLVHAMPAFFIQPKSILAYITQNKKSIFRGDLAAAREYFPDTYLIPEPLGNSYFSKPIWGREGRGCTLVDKGVVTEGRYQEDYYTSQKKVYQELLELPKIELEGKLLTLQYEQWVYRVGGQLKPGGLGVRATEHLITDDYSYWLPIGL